MSTIIILWVLLIDALRTIVNKIFKESFDTTFMENIKNCHGKYKKLSKQLQIAFFFFHQKFLKIVYKQISLDYPLTFLLFYIFNIHILMSFTSDDDSLSSNQNINQFLM